MQPGNYVVGYFRGVIPNGNYLNFAISDNPQGEGFVQNLSFRKIRDDGSETVPTLDTFQVGDKVLVRVFEEAKSYVRDGEKKLFVSRRVMAAEVLDDVAS